MFLKGRARNCCDCSEALLAAHPDQARHDGLRAIFSPHVFLQWSKKNDYVGGQWVRKWGQICFSRYQGCQLHAEMCKNMHDHFFGIFIFLQCFSQQDGSNLFKDLILRLGFVAEFVRAAFRGCRLHTTNISCLRSALAHVYATVLTTINVSISFLIDDLQIYIAHEPFIWCSPIFSDNFRGHRVEM